MPAVGMRPQGAWGDVLDGTELTGALVGAASSARTSQREVDWILANVVDDDGTLRVVTV